MPVEPHNRTQFSATGAKGVEMSFAHQWTHENLPVRNADVIGGTGEHCIKNINFKFIKIRTGFHYIVHTQQRNLRLGCMRLAGLDIAVPGPRTVFPNLFLASAPFSGKQIFIPPPPCLAHIST